MDMNKQVPTTNDMTVLDFQEWLVENNVNIKRQFYRCHNNQPKDLEEAIKIHFRHIKIPKSHLTYAVRNGMVEHDLLSWVHLENITGREWSPKEFYQVDRKSAKLGVWIIDIKNETELILLGLATEENEERKGSRHVKK